MKSQEKEKIILQQIKKIRNQKGYSQQYLALKLGIDQSTYNKLESGFTNIRLYQLFLIIDVFEMELISFLKLCGFKDNSLNLPEHFKKFENIERLLNELNINNI